MGQDIEERSCCNRLVVVVAWVVDYSWRRRRNRSSTWEKGDRNEIRMTGLIQLGLFGQRLSCHTLLLSGVVPDMLLTYLHVRVARGNLMFMFYRVGRISDAEVNKCGSGGG